MSNHANTIIPHPVATANRLDLATRIVTVLDESPDLFPEYVTPSAESVAAFGPTVWGIVNERVTDVDGEVGRDRPISPTTVATVIGFLAARGTVIG